MSVLVGGGATLEWGPVRGCLRQGPRLAAQLASVPVPVPETGSHKQPAQREHRWDLQDHHQAAPLQQQQAGLRAQPPSCEAQEPGAERQVRFLTTVQEKRYEGQHSEPEVASPKMPSRPGGWRATITPDGRRYFYHVRTREQRDNPPEECEVGAPGLRLGDRVQVFSNTRGRWCEGYVERVQGCEGQSAHTLTVAFQFPGAGTDEWIKKELPADHKDIRSPPSASEEVAGVPDSDPTASLPIGPGTPTSVVGRPRLMSGKTADSLSSSGEDALPLLDADSLGGSGGFQDTELPANWTQEEEAFYNGLFSAALSSTAAAESASTRTEAGLDWQAAADLLRAAGLPRRAAKEILQVSNPDLRPSMGAQEFRTCCRLVAHCQALASAGGELPDRLLRTGGAPLRGLLRGRFATTPPPRMPQFRAATASAC